MRKVIPRKNMPTRMPVGFSILLWLVLDRLNAPGWVWGAVGVLILIIWVMCIHSIVTEETFEIFERDKPKPKNEN